MDHAGTKILVVDDEPLNLEIISEFLEDSPYLLETAGDGVQAWEKLCENPFAFNAVCLDRMMPNMDGIEVLRKMKENPDLASIPVIMQTAAAGAEDVVSGLDAGAFYYLTKPFEEEVLRSIVDAAVQDYQRYKDLRELVSNGARVMGLMTSSRLELKTVEEARSTATFLASACPQPERVVTGLSELLLNGVEHGNLGITYDEKSELNGEGRWAEEVQRRLALPENADKVVNVEYKKRNGEIVIKICDQGKGFDWEPYLEMDTARAFHSHGRGIAMARMLSFDELNYLGKGNEVEAHIKLQ